MFVIVSTQLSQTQDRIESLQSQLDVAESALDSGNVAVTTAQEEARRFCLCVYCVCMCVYVFVVVNSGTFKKIPCTCSYHLSSSIKAISLSLSLSLSVCRYSALNAESQDLYQRELVQHGKTMSELASLKEELETKATEVLEAKNTTEKLTAELETVLVSHLH